MKIRFHKFLLSIITTAASLSFTAPVWAAAEARFTDGGLIDQAVRPNDPMGVQDAVDAVPGMKGEGWLGPWRVATNGCCGRKVIVNDGNDERGLLGLAFSPGFIGTGLQSKYFDLYAH
jgi:hypothetical protein